MKNLFLLTLTVIFMAVLFVGCQNNSSNETSQTSNDTNAEVSTDENQSTDTTENTIGTVSNTIAVDENSLISANSSKFEQKTYTDTSSGLSITYSLYLPENYDASSSYPMVVFIADASTVGDDASVSITQGRGAVVWASEEWQSVNPTIVAVPSYPEVILDDHDSYTTTGYVELTKRFIDNLISEYAVDESRVYGTGQSMGAMTTMLLAATYPELYAATMIVDGQWDISKLSGLESQKFVYFAAEDDEKAWTGAQEVMQMFDTNSTYYEYAQWDGNWSPDELSQAAKQLFEKENPHNFISWKTGTVIPLNGGAGYHMASFDYAYNCIAVMEWLFQQQK